MDNSMLYSVPDFTVGKRNTVIDSDHQMEHLHNAFEICFFIKADINVFIKNTQYTITDGDIILICPYEIHKFIYKTGIQYTRYVINFSHEYIQSILNSCNIQNEFGQLINSNNRRISLNKIEKEVILGYFNKICHIYELSKPTNENNALIKANMILLLVELINLNKTEDSFDENSKTKLLVNKIIEYIELNFCNPFTLTDLEKEFHYTKFYISKTFKKITGFTLIDFIQHRRIMEAQRLFTEQNNNIEDVYYKIGFNNIQHFYKVFKRITNSTPCAYIKKFEKHKKSI